jgi:uncharacterized protein YndB with AHSA1/START domain
MTDLELTVKKTIKASQKATFDAWLDPKSLTEFIRPGPGMTVPEAKTDPQVGGAFKIVMRAGETDLVHEGTYQKIEPHERLVFTWLSGHTIPGSTVTLTFKAVSDKETEVTLHHKGFPSEDSRNNHQGGWTSILETQAAFLT